MSYLKKNLHWISFFFLLLTGALFILYLNNNFNKKEEQERNLRLQHEHSRTVDRFTTSVDKFAGLVAGMRSFMNLSTEMPTAEEFQEFVRNQYADIKSEDSIVVSFIDTNHVFRQSFKRDKMNPAGLVGTSVSSLRSDRKIKMLDALMAQDSLRVFPPLNLIEGWVGVPIDFRVKRNGRVLGYVAAIVDFKSIIQDIYDDADEQEFVFHFSTQEGYDFDREQTYNNTKVYNTDIDTEYYKNYMADTSSFIYSDVTAYGFGFKIGTAYKPGGATAGFSSWLLLWYCTFLALAFAITLQVRSYKKLSSRLEKANELLVINEEEIQRKNDELSKMNQTQKRFFSIIGHDMKQPLNSIEGMLHLLRNEEINNPGLTQIIDGLTDATSNTVDLLNNLLRWALSQTGDIRFQETSFHMNHCLVHVGSSMQQHARAKGIRLTYQLEEEVLFRGDSDMMQTVFRNLISNAIKFTEYGGEINLGTQLKNGVLRVWISDNGTGMHQEQVDGLFRLDARTSSSGTHGEEGTGLGLILCHNFVERHGGHIVVESKLKEGTRFTIVLPNRSVAKEVQIY
ncbi:HAMP domain-containing sensor histidine kinase [Aureisphaera galaxeae]|uniref:sensor histidine kinase n=1 Tax=Aureisphaera galaxeae TaxID=1538023 RepID=UPI0023509A80|nr:HAMP domain-containing sensor histidine kinase [Aureisphaera galaxeae]MDC8005339.1 HAMP domain-containing sensor histidine kinase [Aureisphaera galaxeae]